MAQHFLLSKTAKTLTLASVFRMSDAEAEVMFCKVRWADTQGKPVCPHCGGLDAYEARRPKGLLRFRCRACRKDFTITSGTLFASHKLPLRGYLVAIAIFCNEVKGKSALALSRDLGVSYKAAFVLSHKLREAMAEELPVWPSARTSRVSSSSAAAAAAAAAASYPATAERLDFRAAQTVETRKPTHRPVVAAAASRAREAPPARP